MSSQLAGTRDCLHLALSLASEGSGMGAFHTSGVRGDRTMSASKVYNSCTVVVSLSGASANRVPWVQIGLQSTLLISLCCNGQYPHGQTGGVITSEASGLQIWMGRSAERPNNNTCLVM